MLPLVLVFVILVGLLSSLAAAQYPPQPNLTTIASPVNSNITISYKSPQNGTCTTVFDDQQQYTGWVNIPGDYPTNTFFWFIAGRTPTSQLTIWLNGGPGSSSMIGLFTENGPCEVIETAEGQMATIAREWGWDRGSNMLYIDQPNQVGFSYDTPTNCSLDLLTSDLYTPQQSLPNSQPADTFLNGTFSSLNSNYTSNTTQIAAMAIWHMIQGFFGAFPQYDPSLSSTPTVGVNLFAESYGGKFGPAFATLWEEQNLKRSNGSIPQNGTYDIKLVSLGIVNGCVDDLIQAPYYPIMAVNNTYGLTSINPTEATLASASFSVPGGCQDLITQCRSAVATYDSADEGDVATVDSICSAAYSTCTTSMMAPYYDSGRSVYDIGHLLPDPFPPSTYLDYLNSEVFQVSIGTPVNYTMTSNQVVAAFTATGDYERDSLVPAIAALLNSGVRVGLMYGDRDYICNWLGGEAISLAVAANASGSYAAGFPAAGYAPIITNSSYIGGAVRQFGNLSFSRIYDAGHSVPAYQPETAFQVFARIITGTSLSTGAAVDLARYDTTGPQNATHANTLPQSPAPTCWLRNIPETCTDEDKNLILDSKGVVIDGVVYAASSDYSSAASEASAEASSSSLVSSLSSSAAAASEATATTTTTVYTGLFTATTTPTMTTAGAPRETRMAVSGATLYVVLVAEVVISLFG